MGAAAQFDRIMRVVAQWTRTAHGKDADLVAVFLAEQRHGARRDGVVRRHEAGGHVRIMADLRVHVRLDRGDLRMGERFGMRIVETQPVGRDQTTLLRHMRAQFLAQRGVEQMGGAVVGADAVAAVDIDSEMDSIANLDAAGFHRGAVGVDAAKRLGGILDRGGEPALRRDAARVAHLPAAFAVERRLVGDDRHRLTSVCAVEVHTVLDDGQNLPFAIRRGIADEFGVARLFGDVVPDFVRRLFARPLPRGAGGGLLLRHGGVETGAVDAETLRAQCILGQVVGEAVGIIELERGFARQGVAFVEADCRFIKQAQAVFQRLAEAGFLAQQGFLNQRLSAHQFGEGAAHFRHEAGDEAVHQRVFGADDVRVAHRAAHDPAQHIAAAFIGGQHAVRDQEAGRAEVIGDDAVAGLKFAVGGGAGDRARFLDQRPERVGVVIIVNALHHSSDALQPHAGVDAGPGQFRYDLVRFLLILHEDEVPDLDETVAILLRRSGRAAPYMVAMVVEDFRAGTAGSAVTHRPEIVLGRDADDPLFGQARNLLPQVERLVIRVVDGRGQFFGGQPPFPGQQGPGMGDRLLLEIVAEAEIPQHFKEGMMARGVADIVEIIMLTASAHAFLARRRGLVGAGFKAREDILERHHARIDEHQRRVVMRHQRRGRNDAVPGGPEIIEERAANVVGRCHERGFSGKRVDAQAGDLSAVELRTEVDMGGERTGGFS